MSSKNIFLLLFIGLLLTFNSEALDFGTLTSDSGTLTSDISTLTSLVGVFGCPISCGVNWFLYHTERKNKKKKMYDSVYSNDLVDCMTDCLPKTMRKKLYV